MRDACVARVRRRMNRTNVIARGFKIPPVRRITMP